MTFNHLGALCRAGNIHFAVKQKAVVPRMNNINASCSSGLQEDVDFLFDGASEEIQRGSTLFKCCSSVRYLMVHIVADCW